MPALFEQAKANLVDAPEVWNRVAREENDGNIDLIDKTLRSRGSRRAEGRLRHGGGPSASPRCAISTRSSRTTLSQKTSDWRLGKEKYARKFDYMLATGKTPEQMLAEAEADLTGYAGRDGQAGRARRR